MDVSYPRPDPLHIHYASHTRDCDGKYDREWDDWLTHETAPTPDQDFYDIRVFERALTNLSNFRPEYEQSIVIRVAEGGSTILMAHEQTDEGYSSQQAIICGDPNCEPQEVFFRDHTAERAGY